MEFLALLAIFYFFNLIFGKKKPKREQRRRRPEADTEQRTGVEDDWDKTMKELERIFSGEPEEEIVVVDEPKQEVFSPRQETQPAYQSPNNSELERQQKLAGYASDKKRKTMDKLEIDSSNPIYADGITSVQEKHSEIDVAASLSEPTSIVQAIVLKEVLDKPKSMRR